MESRKRVKDQLARIDSTYPEVDFHYLGTDGTKRRVTTVEEEEYPQFYHLKPALDPKEQEQTDTPADGGDVASDVGATGSASGTLAEPALAAKTDVKPALEEGHHVFTEDRKGISYDRLFGPYIAGASKIIVTDPLCAVLLPDPKHDGVRRNGHSAQVARGPDQRSSCNRS